uniref:Dynein light chain n=1 Tax=Strigamia maritima TaxID=126957 RepID=T1IH09_STRMM
MPEEMKNECAEICSAACEKYLGNNEACARHIKETMDKKFGPTWHVVVGEGFGFIITYEIKSLLYLYFGVNGVCIWKCA